MTPGARLQSAIELLTAIDQTRSAADDIVGGYFRSHRFVGSKDRAAISEHIYAVLRRRGELDWWICREGAGLPCDARTRLLVAVILVEGWRPDAVYRACDGDRFRPDPPTQDEGRLLDRLARVEIGHAEMPASVRGNFQEWLEPHLAAAFGADLAAEAAALNGSAPLDLRVNALKSNRADARAALAAEGVEAVPTPLAPTGLRVYKRIPLSTLEVFKSGRIEVQDEGSQLAALLAFARPGMRVVDFCAGAGGKTMALAAAMANKGQLIACDISAKRLERSAQRLRRAGVSNVERRALSSERDKWVKHHAESFDRVFVDAPCTGTGTWRRNPDAKWRLTPNDLAELTALQAAILDSAQRLVKPGGRLVYATCSVLAPENDEQIAGFLAGHPLFRLVPMGEVWRAALGFDCPVAGDTLHLTPAKHGTDGFFVAVMERAAAALDSVEPQDEPPEAIVEDAA
ncbi:MAG TPA: RsmB/NOP family class I SAM-dependent RNA methyltransferase [Stellaceae bacterium]|nr:RsmB/NOP family class I SAM-dependent RNA methyltransferase [Stellaceae bacterium]